MQSRVFSFGFNATLGRRLDIGGAASATLSLALAAALLAVSASSAAGAEPSPKSFSRAQATRIIADARRIVTPRGIERLEKVHLSGIDQWVSIRGADNRNPVLLLIHGGPGYVSIPLSWWFTRGWEEYFTVVQWDQRGSGKTYLLNSPAAVAPTLTLERMVADAEDMTDWARKQLGKQKVFVIGQSFGSYLGLELARRHPDWLYAYIGVGQLTDGPESERRGWNFAHAAAQRAGNAQAVRELESIAPYFSAGRRPSLDDIYTQRKWVEFYGGLMAYRQGGSAESHLVELSPDYTDEEIEHIWQGNEFIERYLLAQTLGLDLSRTHKLDCPLIVFAGRHDYVVNAQLAATWFESVSAPAKQFVWFENSGHLIMSEEPGKFLISLLRYARPFAERAGDVAPERPASAGQEVGR
jgi:proline iminopeptidase